MSGNERNEDQLRHERLCAYLFGELSGDERAAVEAELERDAELRAEHEKLAATIALVRDAVPAGADASGGGGDVLSDATRGALTAAANKRGGAGLATIHPWPVRVVRSPLTAAAAVLLALGGIAGLALHQGPPAPGTTRSAETLSARQADEAPRAKKPHGSLLAKHRAAPDGGVAGAAASAPAEREAGREADREADRAAGFDASNEDAPRTAFGRADAPSAAGEPTQALDSLSALEESEEAADAYVDGKEQLEVADELLRRDKDDAKGEFLGLLSESADAAERGEPKPDPAVRSRELRALGYTGAPQTENKEVLRASLELSSTRGGGGPSTPGPGGPVAPGTSSSPVGGPGSPGPGAGGGGSSGWFLGEGQQVLSDSPFDSEAFQPASDPASKAAATSTIAKNENLGELLARGNVGSHSSTTERQLLAKLGYGPGSDDDGDGRRRYERGIDRVSPQDLISFCRIRPHETPSAMFFRCWGDNPFELAQLDPLSTFAADVDTASYALARNYLSRGLMPTKAQIRTEEFVNSFDSGVPAPVQDTFGIDLEMAPSRFGSRSEWMLRVVVRGKEVDKLERPPLALTFVVDTSGSMKQGGRMELVKHALRLLVAELDQNDAISIVAFSTEARLVLPMTSAGNKAVIESAIFGLNPDGSTNAEAGLMMGYAQAAQGLTPGANNRVVMLSDGVANVGNVDQARLLDNVKLERAKGIYLNTIGVGMGNHNDALLEQLADKGDGICNYIDTQDEAVRVLVDGFTGQFVPIARDVKIQVEFDPAQVQSYRLLGYENRAIADARFRDDTVDAGEVGAGHQVTALYEIVRNPTATNDGPLATARVRYKPPFAIDRAELSEEARQAAEVATEIEKSIEFRQVQTAFQGTTTGYQKSVLVAQLAEFLRRSVHARGDSVAQLVVEALRVQKLDEDPAFTEFTKMVARHADLIERNLPADDAVAQTLEELTRRNYLKGLIEQLEFGSTIRPPLVEGMQQENDELEQRLIELLEQQLKQSQDR